MPIPDQISRYLNSQHVDYQAHTHSRAYTAQGTAQAEHVSGKKIAKVVIIEVENRKQIMAVVPANCRVDLERLGRLIGANMVHLAKEEAFKGDFPDCELGAMPPLGNIYHMEVWVDESLKSCPTITFNGGTHAETIHMFFSDFEHLVRPQIGSFAAVLH
jgi:Ala-tRNA(Pro) deacylase